MRWQIIFLLIIGLLLIGCTREIIRETTIIKDSTPVLEEKLQDLKERLFEMESKFAEYEASVSLKETQTVIIEQPVQTTQQVVPEVIPPAPLNTTVSSHVINPKTIIIETNESEQIKAELNVLFDKADSRVKSYSFIYSFQSSPLTGDTFYIKGDKIKIKLRDTGIYNFEDYFDTVYLDLTNKTAVGYCEAPIEACRKGKNSFNLDYDNYKIKTPTDWLEELRLDKDNVEYKGGIILFERRTAFLQKDKNYYWLDEFSGLPIKVKIRRDTFDDIYDYRHLSLNYLSDSDVVPDE